MAKTSTTNTAPVTDLNAGFSLPDGFEDLGLDRFLYKPELCKEMPLQGYLIDVQEFGRDKADKDEHWDALVVRTTAPTLVVTKDNEGKEVATKIEAGEEVMIPITDKLEKLRDFAKHETLMAEFVIKPIEKVTLELNANGTIKKSMWRYKAGGKQPVPRLSSSEAMWGGPALPAKPAKSNGAQLPG